MPGRRTRTRSFTDWKEESKEDQQEATEQLSTLERLESVIDTENSKEWTTVKRGPALLAEKSLRKELGAARLQAMNAESRAKTHRFKRISISAPNALSAQTQHKIEDLKTHPAKASNPWKQLNLPRLPLSFVDDIRIPPLKGIKLSHFPNELRIAILENLMPSDVANLRLTAKEWASIGAEYIFNEGKFFLHPHPDSMSTLLNVCANPTMKRGVKIMVVLLSDMRYELLQTTIAKFTSAPAPFELLRLMGKDGDLEGMHCIKATLEYAIASLTNLKSICVSSDQYPFRKSEGRRFESLLALCDLVTRRSVRAPELVSQQYMNVITILETSPRIRGLTLDVFPTNSFTKVQHTRAVIDREKVRKLKHSLSALSSLEIGDVGLTFLDNSAIPSYDSHTLEMVRVFHEVIGSISSLTRLSLDLRKFRNWDSMRLGTEFGESFSNIFWPCLEHLAIYIEVPATTFMGFLTRHNSTLRSLSFSTHAMSYETAVLGQPANMFYSAKQLLTTIRDTMNIKSISLCSGFQEVPIPPGYISAHMFLEFYVLGQCNWPMISESPIRRWRGNHRESFWSLLQGDEIWRGHRPGYGN